MKNHAYPMQQPSGPDLGPVDQPRHTHPGTQERIHGVHTHPHMGFNPPPDRAPDPHVNGGDPATRGRHVIAQGSFGRQSQAQTDAGTAEPGDTGEY